MEEYNISNLCLLINDYLNRRLEWTLEASLEFISLTLIIHLIK